MDWLTYTTITRDELFDFDRRKVSGASFAPTAMMARLFYSPHQRHRSNLSAPREEIWLVGANTGGFS